MDEIGVCIVVNELYYQVRYCIENLVSKTKCNIRLHILDNGSKDERTIDYLDTVCKEKKWFLKRLDKPVSFQDANNLIIQHSYQKYVCMFPVNVFVNKNWCEDLYNEYIISDIPGVLGIRDGFEKVSLVPVIHKCEAKDDYFKNVWFSDNNTIKGILFFSRERLNQTGVFDTRFIAPGYEVDEFTFRFSANGYNNYYITNQTCTKVSLNNEILFPSKTIEGNKVFKAEIDTMVKTKHFKK